MTTEKQPAQFVFQLEIRPEKRKSPEFRLLVDALLSAAREELEWERQEAAKKPRPNRQRRAAS
jgi:hypothetical protein